MRQRRVWWFVRQLRRGEGKPGDLELLTRICGNMAGLTICPLADAAVMPMRRFIERFRGEFEARIHETATSGSRSRWARGE